MKTTLNGSWIEKAANTNAREYRACLLAVMNEYSGKVVELINDMHECDIPIIIASLHHIESSLRLATNDLGRSLADDLIDNVTSVSSMIKAPKRED